ncbi:hypothetical protein V6Z11_D05G400100 [Gossypium hirsutum]
MNLPSPARRQVLNDLNVSAKIAGTGVTPLSRRSNKSVTASSICPKTLGKITKPYMLRAKISTLFFISGCTKATSFKLLQEMHLLSPFCLIRAVTHCSLMPVMFINLLKKGTFAALE